MILRSLHIISFGGLKNCDIMLNGGVNVIDGPNESGKSSAAMFIKFIFYGLSGKAVGQGWSERQKYVSRDTLQASGYIIAEASDGTLYRLERNLIISDSGVPRERVRIVSQKTGEVISGRNPGEYFFNLPEDVFTGTCFVAQASAVKPASGIGKAQQSGNAVENLLSSADENVDVARAVKKLDESRRELLHKRGGGGEIPDLASRRDALAAELAECADKSREIVSLSTSLDDIRKRIESLEESRTKYEAVFSALDRITVKRRLDSAEQTKAKISELDGTLEAMDRSVLGAGFEESLAEAERDVAEYDGLCEEFDSRMNEPVPEDADTDVPDYDDCINEIYSALNSSRTMFRLMLGMLFSFIIGLAATAVLYIYNTNAQSVTLIVSAAALALMILFLILFIVKKNKYNSLLYKYGAENEDEIESAVQTYIDGINASNFERSGRKSLLDALEASRLRFGAAEANIEKFAKAAKIELSDNIYDTIDALKKTADENKDLREKMEAKKNVLSGRLEVLSEQLSGIDPEKAYAEAAEAEKTDAGRYVLSLDQDGIKSLAEKRNFTDNALKAAQKRAQALGDKLAEIGRLPHTPDELATRISALDRRIEELSLRHDACELAKEGLLKAGEALRSGVIPKICDAASELIANATGKYSGMKLSDSLACALTKDDDTVTQEFLSHGTGDLAYIALRIALAEEVFKEEMPPVIFDESFAHIDGSRIKNVMRMLSAGDTGLQYLILTCRTDETAAADTLGCNIIRLG